MRDCREAHFYKCAGIPLLESFLQVFSKGAFCLLNGIQMKASLEAMGKSQVSIGILKNMA